MKRKLKQLVAFLLIVSIILPGVFADAENGNESGIQPLAVNPASTLETKIDTFPQDILDSEIDLRNMFSIPQPDAIMNNDAYVFEDQPNVMQLTMEEESQAGMAYYAYRIPVDKEFNFKGKIYLGDKAEADGGGYGMTFVLHNNELDDPGSAGGGLGVGSGTQVGTGVLNKGLVVEFDTHFETDTRMGGTGNPDYGEDYDISQRSENSDLNVSNHLMHTAIQALGMWPTLDNKGMKGLGDYRSADDRDSNWHKATQVVRYSNEKEKERIFGQWLNVEIDWTMKGGDHYLGYALKDADGSLITKDEVNIEGTFNSLGNLDVMQAVFTDTQAKQGQVNEDKRINNVYWGFTAGTSLKTTALDPDGNTNEHAFALTELPLEADAEVTKEVRKIAKEGTQESFSGSTTVEKDDIVEYKIRIEPQPETVIPLAMSSFYDTLEEGQELDIDSIQFTKRGETFAVDSSLVGTEAEYVIDKGDESDNNFVDYEDSDPANGDLDPKYLYDEDTGELVLYGLGTLGKYSDLATKYGGTDITNEEIEITFQAKVTSAGKNENGTIYNKGNVHAGTVNQPIKTNSHLDEDELKDAGLTKDGETQIFVQPDVKLEKTILEQEKENDTDSDKVFYEGNDVTYILKASNEGLAWMNGSIEDTLPKGISFDKDAAGAVEYTYYKKVDNGDDTEVTGKGEISKTYTENNSIQKLTFTDIVLEHDEYIIIKIKTKIDSGTAGKTLKNEAEAKGKNASGDYESTDKAEASLDVSYRPGTLAITKEAVEYKRDGMSQAEAVDADKKLEVGDEVTYKITVKNNKEGGTIVKNVEIVDELDAAVEYVANSASVDKASAPTPTYSAPEITAQIGDVKQGETVTLTYKVTIKETASGEVPNTAIANGEHPDDSSNIITSGEVEEKINVDPKLSIEKKDGTANNAVFSGGNITYTIKVSNAEGGGQWKGKVKDTISDAAYIDWPANVPYSVAYTNSGSPSGFSGIAAVTNGVFETDELTLQSGDSAVITYTLKTKTLAGNVPSVTVNNKAQVNPGITGEDPLIAETDTKVVPNAGKLKITKEVYDKDGTSLGSGNKVKVGDTIMYKLIVKNTEAVDTIVNNIVVSDELPAEVTYVGPFTAGGTEIPKDDVYTVSSGGRETLSYTIDSLRGGKEVEITFLVEINSEASGEIENTAKGEGTVPTVPEDPDSEDPSTDTGTGTTETDPDVTIKKTVTPDKVYRGEEITYTITLSNAKGGGKWTGELKDAVPADATYVSSKITVTDAQGNETIDPDPDGYWTGDNFKHSNIELKSGEVYTLTFTVTADKKGTITNTASADGEDGDGNTSTPTTEGGTEPDGDSETVTTKVGIAPGKLEVKKTVSDEQGTLIDNKLVSAGDTLKYTITARNISTAPESELSKIVIEDKLPEGVNYSGDGTEIVLKDGSGTTIPTSEYTAVYANGTLKITMDNDFVLDSGEAITFTIEVKVDDDAIGKLKNTAKAAAESPEDVKDDNSNGPGKEEDTDTVKNYLGAAVSIKKTTEQSVVTVGEDITYKIVVSNRDGASTWKGTLTDLLPDGTSYKSHNIATSGSATAQADFSSGKLRVDIEDLAGGDSVTITFVVTADDTKLGDADGVKNQATAIGEDDTGEPHDPDPSEEVETKIDYKDGKPAVKKYVYSTDAAYPFGSNADQYSLDGKTIKTSDTLRYVIKLKNTVENGKLDLDGYQFADELNEYLNYVNGTFKINNTAATPSVGNNGNKTTLSYLFSNMKITDEEVIIAFDVTLSDEAVGKIENIARVTKGGSGPEDEIENKAEYDLTLEKSVDETEILVGEELVYTIKASNAAGAGLYEGKLKDEIPGQLDVKKVTLELNGGSPQDITSSLTGNKLEHDIKLKGGESAIIKIYCEGAEESIVSNKVILDNGVDDPEESTSDKTKIGKPGVPDVALTKDVDPGSQIPGGQVTYKITAENSGNGTWFGEIEDAFPAELENYQLVSVTGGGTTTGGFGLNSNAANVLTVRDIELAEGEKIEIICTADIKEGIEEGVKIKNVATGSGKDEWGNTHDPEDDDATAIVVVLGVKGDLVVKKTVESLNADTSVDPDLVKAEHGDIISYAIKAGNDGDDGSTIQEIEIVDTLPEGLALIPNSIRVLDKDQNEFTGNIAGVSVNGQKITVVLDGVTLEKDEYVYLHLDVIVTATLEGVFENVVEVEALVSDPKAVGKVSSQTRTAQAVLTMDEFAGAKDDEGVYKVEYYYDGTLDSSATVTDSIKLGSTVNSFINKNKDGYILDSVEGLPLVVSKDESKNLIRVYYVKDGPPVVVPEIYKYTIEYYYDNVKDGSKTETGTAELGAQISGYTPKLESGFIFDRTEGLPLTIGSNESNNVIRVYYVTTTVPQPDIYKYSIEYYYDGTINNSYTVNGTAYEGDVINNYLDKQDEGYEFDKVEGLPLTVGSNESGNVIRVYYKQIPVEENAEYTIEYYYDNVIDSSATKVISAKVDTTINYYLDPDNMKDGYEFDKVEGLPLTVTLAGPNIIKVYYKSIPEEEKTAFYHIIYYYDGVIDASAAESEEAKVGEEITSYPDKVKTGFKLDEVKNFPLTIQEDETKNIIEVFYVSEKDNPKDPDPKDPKDPKDPVDPKDNGDGGSSSDDESGEDKSTGGNKKTVNRNTTNHIYRPFINTSDTTRILMYVIGVLLSLGVILIIRKKRKREVEE